MITLEIRIEKAPIPIIWLDTSVIIRMTKYKHGETLTELERDRYGSLYEVLYKKVREDKIICPKADQQEEIELGFRLEKECHDLQVSLSLGISFKHRAGIDDNQRQIFMKAYIDGDKEVSLNYRDAFYKDPIKELKSHKQFIISVFSQTKNDEVHKRIQTKRSTLEQLEKLRQEAIAKGISFEEQLKEEYTGIVQAGIVAIENWTKKLNEEIMPTVDDYFQVEIIALPLSEWKRYSGKPEGFEGLFQFFLSDTYKCIPSVDISAKLWAKVVTGSTEIQSGDSMDIDQLSAVIPYSNYVITDRKMKNRIIELELDKKYNTEVFCISDYEKILEKLNSI